MKTPEKQQDVGIVQLSHRPIDYPNLSEKEKEEMHRELVSALEPFFETLRDCDPS